MLLSELLKTDPEAWEMALLSLHTGLRAGEIFKLTWGDIDAGRSLVAVRDTKSGRNRFAHMTGEVRDMLAQKQAGEPSALLYPGPEGAHRREVPRSIKKARETLGFNEGRADRRQKLCFHSLRHSFASHLVQDGVDLYTVREMLGHSTLQMTARYSHLAPENTKRAVAVLESALREQPDDKQAEANS